MFEPSSEMFFELRKLVSRRPLLKIEPSKTRFADVDTFSRFTGPLK